MNTENIFSEYMKEKHGVTFPGEINFQKEKELLTLINIPHKYSPCKFVIRVSSGASIEEILNLAKDLLKEGDSLELFFISKEK